MAGMGTVAIMILFAVAFVFYVYNPEYGFGFVEFLDSINNNDMSAFINGVLSSLFTQLAAATIGIAAVAALATRNSDYLVAAFLLIGVNALFVPFTFATAVTQNVPFMISILVRGFFNIILLLAIIGFIMGRDF